ncbi:MULTISPECIES: GFA family protein [unclassified Modicisalibacter]|uniref:GFA family protein n=1 Tax=unclassified Modicisalibacter TaxID=2679913 RepID=UPI001CCCAC96|nr:MULTISPECIES: GFA family protein [unclassified Modicisalibacter]MBZ9556787.1 GFA family protein [Modicisalibacter sp. R2A 31.J]MBZ9574744.1 GFA family protein [Modicisalibacter sp. MOD 31.J]
MNATTLSTKGYCRCGQTAFEVRGKPMITMACHCTGCQRMTSSAFSLSSLFHSTAFSITSGEPVIGGLHGSTCHFFCGHCMSWLFTRPEGMDDFVNVRATMLEDARAFRPFVETYTDEKLEWATTGAEHSFCKFPPQDKFPELLQAYAQRPG